DRMPKPLEERRVKKRQLDAIANSLDSFLLPAYGAPRNRFDAGERPIDALAGANNFNGDALLAIQPQIQPQLELFLRQQGRTAHDSIRNARFVADSEAPIREQLGDADHWPVFLKSENISHRKRLIAKQPCPRLQQRFWHRRIEVAHILSTLDAYQRAVIRQFLE